MLKKILITAGAAAATLGSGLALANPPYWALQEKTLNVGLRRAGFPDE